MPSDLVVGACTVGQMRYDIVEQSDSTGIQAVRLLGPPRWTISMQSRQVQTFAEAGKWEALIYSARGRVNHIAAFDPGRTVPQGTLRGSPVTSAIAAAGATACTLVGGTSGTLLAGDLLQFGTGLGTSQTVKVMADATSSPASPVAFTWDNAGAFSWTNGGAFSWTDEGTIAITFEPPLRTTFVQSTPVNYTRPVIYCKAQADSVQGSYVPGYIGQGGYTLDLLEAFS